MRVRVKVCGITTEQGVAAAVEAGVDALGFVFAPSPRRLDLARARELAALVPPFVARVAVLRLPHPVEIAGVVTGFWPDVLQCEPDGREWVTIGPRTAFLPVVHDGPGVLDLVRRLVGARGAAGGVLLEASGRGGRGVAPDWGRAAQLARMTRLVLAGGLTPENVGEAVRRVRPFAVDVSSGVESAPGMKDPGRIARFVAAVREAGESLQEEESCSMRRT